MFKKILVTTDGSPISTQAAKAGIAFAKSVGAEIVALHVQQPFFGTSTYQALVAAHALNDKDYSKVLEEQAELYIQPILDDAKAAGVTAKARFISDPDVAQSIVNVAEEEGCDLIFIGSHGRSGLSLLFLGSTAARVLPMAKISVLVHRAEEKA